MKKTAILLGTVALIMMFVASCSKFCIECGEVVGISEHPDGHFITMDDIKGRWYVIGTSMGPPEGLTWGLGECPQQYYRPILVTEEKVVFQEIGTWINPVGQFSGLNTIADVSKPYSMEFTKPDSGPMQEVLRMPWTLFAIGSEPAEYLALYFCKPMNWCDEGTTIEQFQGFDIVTRTQNPEEIDTIEQIVLSIAEEQGMFTDHYIRLPQGPGCPVIEDFQE